MDDGGGCSRRSRRAGDHRVSGTSLRPVEPRRFGPLFYGKFAAGGISGPEGLYQSTSADGLTFETEQFDVFMGNDPDAIRLVDGTLAVYYGQFDPVIGGTINVATCPDAGATVAPMRRR